jgi:8-oxo-dGTP diphosphatase
VPTELVRRVGVYGRCVDRGAILLTRLSARDPDEGRWTLPGGGMDFGETAHETLIREFHEETGLVADIGALLTVRSQVYPATDRRGPLQAVQFVYQVTASGAPTVIETDGSTAEAAWVPLGEAVWLPLVDLARWAVAE